MDKILIFTLMTAAGWVGWWLGSKESLTMAFLLSSVGTFAGIYAGWYINRNYL